MAVGYHTYEGIPIGAFLAGLAAADLPRFDVRLPASIRPPVAEWTAVADAPVTVARLFERLGTFLTDDTIVIADPGDAMFGALDLPVRRDHEFLANAWYASLGFAVPASIGAQLAAPSRRPLVLVGDGSFQMTGLELSTSVRFGLSPIVVVFDNGGYAIERMMVDGSFNDVLPWDYTRLPELLGAGLGFDVRTEADLDQALATAAERTDTYSIIRVHLESRRMRHPRRVVSPCNSRTRPTSTGRSRLPGPDVGTARSSRRRYVVTLASTCSTGSGRRRTYRKARPWPWRWRRNAQPGVR